MNRFFKRKKSKPWEAMLTTEQVTTLARYNGRVGRGIVHTKEYEERMAKLQQLFDIGMKRVVTID